LRSDGATIAEIVCARDQSPPTKRSIDMRILDMSNPAPTPPPGNPPSPPDLDKPIPVKEPPDAVPIPGQEPPLPIKEPPPGQQS
jgi:hypothetical protein